MKRSGPLKRKNPLAPGKPLGWGKKKKAIAPRSKKSEKKLKEDYWPGVEVFLRDRPICEICTDSPSTDPHHKAHRDNDHLTDWENMMALCHPCHMEVHHNVKWAREQGYLVSPNLATIPLDQKLPLLGQTPGSPADSSNESGAPEIAPSNPESASE